ncbi:MAG: hypothetical protein HON94_09310 [Methylococcales bacterium]|jgi:hypothetical protein|nr:hypothetical protein [Methylococcales bacterium]MBT7409139.1 hypothetical protein [Methylococcales bacterium]
MKSVILFIAYSLFSQSLFASDSSKQPIVIQIGGQTSSSDRLSQRVLLLEKAVIQLQNSLAKLEKEANSAQSSSASDWACVLKTNFSGTFTATSSKKILAVANVIKKCSKEGNSMDCREKKVVCSNQ